MISQTDEPLSKESTIVSPKLFLSVVATVLIIAAGFFAADLLLPAAKAKAYQYDKQGKLIRRTTPNGRAVKYQYNKAGLVTNISYHRIGAITKQAYPASDSVSFEYDPEGNRIGMKDAQGKTRYGYDEMNRLSEVLDPASKKLSYEYDPWNQLRRLTYSDGDNVKYRYDVLGNLTDVDDGRGAVHYDYKADANQVHRRLPNGVVTIYESSPAGRLNSIRHLKADGSLICSFRYEYDVEERVNAIEEATSQGTSTARYGYDLAGRLSKVHQADGSTVTYEYDVMGNRATQNDGAGTIRYQYDSWGRLIKAGETTFSYDAAGNLISKKDKSRSISYDYDEEDRLIEVRSGKTTIRYGYDGEGTRVRREVSGKATNYLHEWTSGIPQVAGEYSKDGKLSHYLLGVTRLGRRSASGEQVYFLEDYLGSTRCIVDAQGNVAARYSYSAFGAPRLTEGTAQTDFLYTGEQWDPDAQLLYLRSRYYDPEIGRFLSADPLPGLPMAPETFNEYAYVNNDPLNYVDPLGLRQNWWRPPTPPPLPPRPPSYADPFRASRPNQSSSRTFWSDLNRGTYFGTGFGQYATSYWAQRQVDTGNWLYGVPGSFSALWTPETWKQTAATLLLPAVTKGLGALGDSLLARSLQPLARREQIHLQLAGRFAHYGVDVERGAHIGLGWEKGAFLHLYERHINIGGARGLDLAVDWGLVGVGGYNLVRRGADFLSDLWDRRGETGGQISHGLDDLLDQRRNSFFAPPGGGGGGGGGFPSVGGVYLDQTAKLIGELGTITGAMYDAETGQVILVGDKNTALPSMKPEYLAAAIRAVYSQSLEAPGMTIDPNPQNPRGPTMDVKFFGHTENTRLGWVMFEADRLMKGYSVGRDNITKQRVQSSVPDYRSVTAMGLAEGGINPGIWSRFWLVPEPVTARLSNKGQAIIFDPIKIRIRTQTMVWNCGRLVPAGDEIRDAHAELFKTHFTDHYEEFAKENSVYADLKQVTQAVALARWMRSQSVPANWNFVRSLGGAYATPQITPSAYDELSRTSTEGLVTHTKLVSTFGGVEMDPKLEGQAHSDAERFQDTLMKAWSTARRNENSAFGFEFQKKQYIGVALPPIDHREPTAYDAVEADLAGDGGVSAQMAQLPGMARYYNSTHNEPSEFGFAWSLLLPRLEFEAGSETGKLVSVAGDPSTQVLVQSFVLTNDFGLGQERFSQHFVDQNLKRIGFSPISKSSPFRALYPEAEGGYRVFFTSGQQAVFDQQGRLRAVFTPENKEVYNIEGDVRTVVVTPESKALYDYDQSGRLIAIRFASGAKEEQARFDYDSKGRLARCSSGAATATYGYDVDGDLSTVRRGNQETAYRYDGGRLLNEMARDGVTVLRNGYDPLGRLVKQSDSSGSQVDQSVESVTNGTLVTVKDGADFIKRHYDKLYRLTAMEDSAGGSYKYSYDGAGRVSAVDSTLPTGGVARLEISPDRSVITARDPRGVRAEARFDERGKVTEVRVNDHLAAAYRYNAHNNLVEATYGSGEAERFTYDEHDRLSEYQRIPQGGEARTEQILRYSYDAQGNLVGINSDSVGEIQLAAQPQTFTVTRGDATVTYRYDSEGRPIAVELPGGSVVKYEYQSGGRLSGIETASGGRRGRLDLIDDKPAAVLDLLGGTTKYAYNSAGALASVLSTLGETTSYVYDDQNRLREAHFPDGRRIEYRYAVSRSQSQTLSVITHPASERSREEPPKPERGGAPEIPRIRLEDILQSPIGLARRV